MNIMCRNAQLASGVFAVVLFVAGCASTDQKAQPAFKTTTVDTLSETTTKSAADVTATQLGAHLGVGVPNGWDPVDAGNARVWVPQKWLLESKGSCVGEPSAVGMISIGALPQVGCEPSDQYPTPKQAVAVIPSSTMPAGRPALTVHGYRVYNGSPRSLGRWSYYVVPQLGVRIATQGIEGGRILHTLAPSARMVALEPAYESVPSNWHAVTANNVSVSIPPSWTIATPNFFCASPVNDSTLLFVKPDIGVAPCPAPPPTPAAALHDGETIYLPPHNRYAPNPTGPPIATVRNGTTTIAIHTAADDQNALDLYVRKAGSSITHVLAVGLGRDGRIAGGELASIRATT